MDFLGGLFTVLMIFVIGFWLLALLVPTFLRFWIGRRCLSKAIQPRDERRTEKYPAEILQLLYQLYWANRLFSTIQTIQREKNCRRIHRLRRNRIV